VVEVYESDPAVGGSAVRKPLREITFPEGAFVAAMQRGKSVQVPGAEDAILPGDILVVIGPTGIEKRLRTLFIGK